MRAWLQENPKDARTRMRLARTLFDAGQYDAAQQELQLVQQVAPLDPLALEMMNLILIRKRDMASEGDDRRLLQ
jgi:Flp pilus assembly protein TadD